jgi:hypothetical protein
MVVDPEADIHDALYGIQAILLDVLVYPISMLGGMPRHVPITSLERRIVLEKITVAKTVSHDQ